MPRRTFLLRSNISETLFNQFTSSYESIPKIDEAQKPFVYVDQEGNFKLLTNVVGDEIDKDGIFAVSVARDGWMEFLVFNDA